MPHILRMSYDGRMASGGGYNGQQIRSWTARRGAGLSRHHAGMVARRARLPLHGQGVGRPLLIAIRNGYLNVYAEGQSVLRVGFDARRDGGLRLRCRIHRKYVSKDDLGSNYLDFDGHQVTLSLNRQPIQVYAGAETLHGWVEAARRYAGLEKKGVAIIAEKHPSVIDVEMALPADEPTTPHGKKVANRMDIVALETKGESVRLAFYEAKLLSNAELRARNKAPPVARQMENYRSYVSQPERRQEILDAYKNACAVLAAINDMRGIATHPLIKTVSTDGLSELDPEPRLVLFGQEGGKARNKAAWEKHAQILRENGIVIEGLRPEEIELGVRVSD